jgi:hypothetical protein
MPRTARKKLAMAIGIRGFAPIIAVAALMVIGAACRNGAEPTSLSNEAPTPVPPTVGGTTPTDSNPPTTTIVSHGGPVKDYVSLVDNLRAAGATVDLAGTESADYFAPQGQLLTVNGERVETFEFGSAEEADAAAGGVSAGGSSIVTTFADGTGKSSMITWVEPPHFYRASKLIVLYVGCDGDVIDVLQEAMGPQFAGGAGVSQCHQTPPTTSIGQALEAADGSEVTVSGFLVGWGGITSLCSGLLESSPPQCGGDRIDLLEFDASSVPNSKTPQRLSAVSDTGVIGTTRWTDSHITVTGIKSTNGFGFRELAEVRLSTGTESTSTSDEVSTPPGVQPVPAGMGMIAPNLRLTFDEVEYNGVEILGAASPNGPIVCCGTPINMDDM